MALLNNAHSGDSLTADHPKAKFVETFGKTSRVRDVRGIFKIS
jgi:hypothetical protein